MAIVTRYFGTASAGDYLITATIDDGDSNPVQGARVTAILNGALAAVGFTDANGEAQLALDAGTYTITATAGGFVSAFTEHTVTPLAEPVTISISPVTIAPSEPGSLTIWFSVFKDGLPAANVPVRVSLLNTTLTGGYSRAPVTVTTNADGIGQLQNAHYSTTYEIRGVSFTTPESGETFEVPTPFYL